MQAQPVERRLDSLDPSVKQFLQQVRDPPSVNAPDAPIDKPSEITQDQFLRYEKFETVCGHPGKRSRNAKTSLEDNRCLETAAIGDAAARGTLVAVASPHSRALDQAVGVRQDLLGHAGGECAFANAFEDQVTLAPGQSDQPERDPVTIENIFAILRCCNRFVQPLAERLGLRPDDLPRKIVVLVAGGEILAHRLQRDGHYLPEAGDPVPDVQSPSGASCLEQPA